MERQYIPCPACGEIHNAKLWAEGNAFGHWLGFICPSCKSKIPCLWNLTSLALLVVLSPLWFPLKLMFEKKYIEFEVSRSAKQRLNIQNPSGKLIWLKVGLFLVCLFLYFFCIGRMLIAEFHWKNGEGWCSLSARRCVF